ncbi:hypothetical protein KCU95_g16, partial [Aureobasidium melanogenum]
MQLFSQGIISSRLTNITINCTHYFEIFKLVHEVSGNSCSDRFVTRWRMLIESTQTIQMTGPQVDFEIAMEVTVFPPGPSSQSQERLSRNSCHSDRGVFEIPVEGDSVCKGTKTL